MCENTYHPADSNKSWNADLRFHWSHLGLQAEGQDNQHWRVQDCLQFIPINCPGTLSRYTAVVFLPTRRVCSRACRVVSVFAPVFNSLNSLRVIHDSQCTVYLICPVRNGSFQISDVCLSLRPWCCHQIPQWGSKCWCHTVVYEPYIMSLFHLGFVLLHKPSVVGTHTISDLWKSNSHALYLISFFLNWVRCPFL